MANNRLYIADTTTKQWMMISKSFSGLGWNGVYDSEKFDAFLNDNETAIFANDSLDLILFTEGTTELYERFMKDSEYTEFKV